MKIYTTPKLIFIFSIFTFVFASNVFAQNKVYTTLYNNANFTKTIDLTKPVGVVKGACEITNNGASSFTIPIAIPEGTNGVKPQLAVSYNSSAGNGIAGFGWNISGLSVITRSSKSWIVDEEVTAQQCIKEDAYAIDGQRLILLSGTYGNAGSVYAKEAEDYTRIEVVANNAEGPTNWKVTSKDGIVMEYGKTSTSKFIQSNKILFWRLNRVTDRNGNYYEYIYDNSFDDSRVKEINYTGNDANGLMPYNKIKFDYSVRQDKNTIYEAGFTLEQRFILDSISVFAQNNQHYRTYKFNHGIENFYSMLSEVIECATDWTEYNSTIFKYGEKPQDIVNVSHTFLQGQLHDKYPGDFDGDGFTDLLVLGKYTTPANYTAVQDFKVYKQNPTTLFHTQSTPTYPLFNYSIDKITDYANGYYPSASDFNGDGRDDLAFTKLDYTNSSFLPLYPINDIKIFYSEIDATGFLPSNYTLPSGYDLVDKNHILCGDFDGDGRTDMLNFIKRDVPNHFGIFFTNPNSISTYNQMVENPYSNPIDEALEFASSNARNTIYSIDFDGNGKNEILRIENNRIVVYEINKNPSNLQKPYKLNKLFEQAITSLSFYNFYLGDFNGDGKTDIFCYHNLNTDTKILFSDGKKYNFLSGQPFIFNDPISVQVPLDYINNPYAHKIVIADYNGDGKSDIAHCYKDQTASCSSAITEINTYYSTGKNFYYEKKTQSGCFSSNQPIIVDFNGDGRQEIVNANAYTQPFETIQLKPNGTERLLEKITDGMNNTLAIRYNLLTNNNPTNPFFTRGNGNNSYYPLNHIQVPINCVSQFTKSDGIGGFNSIDYKYEELRYHRAGRGVLGFKKVIAIDNTLDVRKEITNLFNTTRYIALNEKVENFQQSTNLALNSATSSYNVQSSGVPFKVELNTTSQVNLLQNVTNSSNYNYDNFGNVTNTTSNLSGLATSTTIRDYGNFGLNFPYLPITEQITNTRSGQPTVEKNTSFDYDNLGRLTEKKEFVGLPQELTSTFTYNSFGNLLTSTASAQGLNDRTETFTYENKNRFIHTKKINCISCGPNFEQKETTVYNLLHGAPSTIYTADCQFTNFEYDAFGILKKTTASNGAITNNNKFWDIAGNKMFYTKTTQLGKPESKVWYDILGREIESKTQGMNNLWHTQKSVYNNKGALASKTNTYYDGLETPIVTSFTYDGLNRISTESNIANTTSYNYVYAPLASSFFVEKTDLSGYFHKSVYDAFNNVKKTEDPGGNINFEYDSWGNQHITKQNGVVVVKKTYDYYNRLIAQEEKNAGTINYNYNAFGEMINQSDANGNLHEFIYDDIGRMTERIGPEGQTLYEYQCTYISNDPQVINGPIPEVENNTPPDLGHYCCTNNIAKITGFDGTIELFTYDGFNRLIQKDETLDGNTYITKFEYDNNDNLISKTYPSGIKINYGYDANGFMTTTQQQGAPNVLLTVDEVNGMGQTTKYTLGNGLQSTNSYLLGLPTSFVTPGVQNYSMGWNLQTTNLSQRHDNINGLSESFTYDNVNRLNKAQVGAYTHETNYDPYPAVSHSRGNIRFTNDGFYRYTSPAIHTQSSIAHHTSTVLPPPNISDETQQIEYTGFLRPARITEGVYEQEFKHWSSYDRSKSVLKQNGAIINTRYYFGDFEIQQITGAASPQEIHYINGANGLAAIIVKEGAVENSYYVYQDHLGSINTITDDAGNIIYEQNFDAWGRNRNPNNWTYTSISPPPNWLYRGFTGHEHMPEFGLINMNARLYDPVVGKMISPDNYVADPHSSQAYNRYSYANNNPLKYVDPDGNFVFTAVLAPIGLAPVGMIIDGAAWGATIDLSIQGIQILMGTREKVNWSQVGGAAVSGAIFAGMGFFAPSFSPTTIGYLSKASYAGFTGILSSGSGMLATDLFEGGGINYSGKDYLSTMVKSGAFSFGLSITTSIYDYSTWDKLSVEKKMNKLQNKFGKNVLYDPDLNIDALYTPGNSYIELGPSGLKQGKGYAYSTTRHELKHLSDVFKSRTGSLNLPKGVSFKNYYETSAYKLEMRYFRVNQNNYLKYSNTMRINGGYNLFGPFMPNPLMYFNSIF